MSTVGVLTDFGSYELGLRQPMVSDICFAETMAAMFERQPGIRALRSVSEAFEGPVFVQPFSMLSESILDKPDWALAKRYGDPVGAYRFMAACRDDYLTRIGSEIGAEILPYPDFGRADGLTPNAFMRDDDVHQADFYGERVLSIFCNTVFKERSIQASKSPEPAYQSP